MVINGSARSRPAELAAHLERTDHNERVHIMDIWGCSSTALADALKEMDAIGAGARSRRTLYHANIDPRKDEQFNEDQKRIAVLRLAEKLGFKDQPRVVVEHVKHGRHHLHVVFGRIDLETMTAIHDGHNYRKHEEVARDLEREFGHERTQGAHVEREGRARPDRAPDFAEYQQAERSGMTPQQAKKVVTDCWQRSATGAEFVERLEAAGFGLARGDRRDFVLIDAAGEIHGLAKRVDKVKAAEIRERMSGIDAAALPDAAQAKQLIEQRHTPPEIMATIGNVTIEQQRVQPIEAAKVTPPPPTVEVQRTPPARDPIPEPRTETSKPSFFDRLFGRVEKQEFTATLQWDTPAIDDHRNVTPRLPAGGISHPAERPAVEVSKAEDRPSAWLFVRIFGILIDAYQQAFDRAKAKQVDSQADRHFVRHEREREVPPPPLMPIAPLPRKRESLADQATRERSERTPAEREATVRAAQQLREQEERRQRERELMLED